jgi:outer membrane protein assembly factor BamB
VVCYDFNGKELWKRDLGKQSHDWGYAASPIIQGIFASLTMVLAKKTALVALDKKTGKTVWQVDIPEMNPTERSDGFAGKGRGYIGSWSTPIVVKAGAARN